jgi:hypothetical protein
MRQGRRARICEVDKRTPVHTGRSDVREHVDQREETQRHAQQPREYVLSHVDLRKDARRAVAATTTAKARLQEAHQRGARDRMRVRAMSRTKFPHRGKDFPRWRWARLATEDGDAGEHIALRCMRRRVRR